MAHEVTTPNTQTLLTKLLSLQTVQLSTHTQLPHPDNNSKMQIT